MFGVPYKTGETFWAMPVLLKEGSFTHTSTGRRNEAKVFENAVLQHIIFSISFSLCSLLSVFVFRINFDKTL